MKEQKKKNLKNTTRESFFLSSLRSECICYVNSPVGHIQAGTLQTPSRLHHTFSPLADKHTYRCVKTGACITRNWIYPTLTV